MHRRSILAGLGSLVLARGTHGETAAPIGAATTALGATATRSVAFTGSGASFTVGQNFAPNDPWPRVTIRRYVALIDYENGAMRIEMLREIGARMPRGGGVPFTGQLPQIEAVSGDFAWNEPVLVAAPGGTGPA